VHSHLCREHTTDTGQLTESMADQEIREMLEATLRAHSGAITSVAYCLWKEPAIICGNATARGTEAVVLGDVLDNLRRLTTTEEPIFFQAGSQGAVALTVRPGATLIAELAHRSDLGVVSLALRRLGAELRSRRS
jgi:hypothetical protein